MNLDPDKLLNRLVVAALTIFFVLLFLLATVVLRQILLQQRIVALSNEVQINLESLEDATEEIQQELNEIREDSGGQPVGAEEWSEIAEALDTVTERLDSLGEDLTEVASVLDPAEEAPPELIAPAPGFAQDQVDQLFTIFALLLGGASVVIAVLLGMAIKVKQEAPDESQPT